MDQLRENRWMTPERPAWGASEPPPWAATEPPAPLGPAQPPRTPLIKRALAPLAALIAVLVKFKGVLLLLPKLKLLATFGSMALSVAAYALIWGWRFAARFLALAL